MKKISQMFFVLIITIKFKPYFGHDIPDLQSDGNINANFDENQKKLETSTFESPVTIANATEVITSSTPYAEEVISYTKETVLKEKSVFNKSIEYLIGEPNISNGSHDQEVIIKPLKEFSIYLNNKSTNFDSGNKLKFPKNYTNLENKSQEKIIEESSDQSGTLQILNSIQNLNTAEPTTLKNISKESYIGDVISPIYEKNEELIINLLNPQNKLKTSILEQTITSSNQSDIEPKSPENHFTTINSGKDSNQIFKELLKKKSTMTSIKMRINPLSQILKLLTKESATLSNDHKPEVALKLLTSENKTIETNEIRQEFMIKPIKLQSPYTVTIEKEQQTNFPNDHELTTTTENSEDFSTEPQKEEFNLKSKDISNEFIVSKSKEEKNQEDLKNPPLSLVQSLTSSYRSSKSEENVLTTKLLEDYAVKQMNFILDHMLLESQEFVAKVLQATGNTIFQRDHLKRYAENLNRLLNPHLDDDYSDDIFEAEPVTQQDLYEEVVKKLDFLKSKATKQLQQHLPADWVKDYKDKREELKIWLDKASNEMHREFNLYLNEEEDHIKYLYFNEAFDDINRSTEIHQKLALLADLIKIVKNKKQITFMDLYMQ